MKRSPEESQKSASSRRLRAARGDHLVSCDHEWRDGAGRLRFRCRFSTKASTRAFLVRDQMEDPAAVKIENAQA